MFETYMLFLIDEDQKIIFGWSAKCGCTHVKYIYWWLKNGNIDGFRHGIDERHSLPSDMENYTAILIIRNPYEKVASGFIDKYGKDGEFVKLWKRDNITFSTFVEELQKNDWIMVDEHHFTPQTSEGFDIEALKKSKCLKVYDVKCIDYAFIEKLYCKKIPENVLKFRGPHVRKTSIETFDKETVEDIDISEYYDYNVEYKQFYTNAIKNTIYTFYQNDFLFFKELGFDYDI
jgi:hypothetical protein